MSTSSFALFGHKYDLTVTTTDGQDILLSSDSWEPEALRITFEVNQTAYQATWDATICIYNLSDGTAQSLITQGAQVVLNAGYQVGSNYGLIFSGVVLRVMFEKENVTDYKITLQCVTGMQVYINALVNFTTGPFQTQEAIIAAMASKSSKPFQVGTTAAVLQTVRLPCPVTMFGQPKKYIEEFARQHNLTWTADSTGQLLIQNLDLATPTPDLIYSSAIPLGSSTPVDPTVTYSIQGTPQQIAQGVVFRVMLDARLQIKLPPMGVKIDNTVIRQLPLTINQYPPVLSKDGIYAVAGLTHRGDSRGTSLWTTEIHGVITNAQKAVWGKSGTQDIHNLNPGNEGVSDDA